MRPIRRDLNAYQATEATDALVGASKAALESMVRHLAAEFAPEGMRINAVSAGTVDTDALLAECASGRLRAALDVTDPEPLPRRHPLWRMPNVLITPHCAGLHAEYGERAARVFLDNLRRYVAGQPLQFVVDKEAGY